MVDRFQTLREVYSAAQSIAPALARRFSDAGLSPGALVDQAALNRLPVLKKETLLQLQQAAPPFAGFLACDIKELGHIYASPGPIFEPSLAADKTGHGMDLMFAAAGIGENDIALNTWSYHLVPAGLLFDQGLRAVGATVIPGGVGASELQGEILINLKATAFLGSTAFFFTLIERLEATGRSLPDDWFLRNAFLGGEFGDWAAKRHRIETQYKVKTWSCYATADFGLIGYEVAGEQGYRIHPDRYLQICDPASGEPLPLGSYGEIVVTTLSRGWPMIRFGTGDVSMALSVAGDGGVSRIAPLQGRVGAAVKIREIFVYPTHVDQLRQRVNGLAALVLVAARPGTREEVTARVVLAPDAPRDTTIAALRDQFPMVTRLTLDHVEVVSATAHLGEGPVIRDLKQ